MWVCLCVSVCVCLCQIEGLEQDRVRLVSDKADLETTVTQLEKSLKDLTMERDDLLSQVDRCKINDAFISFNQMVLQVIKSCVLCFLVISLDHRYIKYSLDFLRPVKTGQAFEAVDWLADLPQ